MAEETLTLEALVQMVEISALRYFEISARRKEDATEEELANQGELTPQHLLNTVRAEDGTGFRIRIPTEIEAAVGAIVADVGIEYLISGADSREISEPMLLDFVNNVAAMTLIPFIRQAIADVSQRVFDSPLMMPITQRGEISFSPLPGSET